MLKYNYIIGAILFFIQLPALAQQGQINFTALSTRDGLLSNSVNAIIKDHQGLMWFATDDGLNKYDGTNFTVYRYQPGDTTSLRTNEVLALHEDRAGNLWVGTSGGGLSRYDRNKDSFVHYPLQPGAATLTASDVIRSICSDSRGRIWIAQYGGLYMLDPATQLVSLHPLRDAAGTLIKTPLTALYADTRQQLWIATENGLFVLNLLTNTFNRYIHHAADAASLPDNRVRALAEDKHRQLWAGSSSGLVRLQQNGAGFIPYSPLNGIEINAIACDEQGVLWIGTASGLYVYDVTANTLAVFTNESRNRQRITSKWVRCAYIDQQGIYWFGTYGGGICKYDKNLNRFNLTLSSSFQQNRSNVAVITAMAENSNGHVLLATDGNGLYEFDRVKEQVRPYSFGLKKMAAESLTVFSLLRTRTNQLYIGTYGKGLLIVDQQTGTTQQLVKGSGSNHLTGNDIFCLFEDSRGNVWIGTNGDGITVMNNGRVIARYAPRPQDSSEMLLPINGFIRAMEEDATGRIWIGTHGGGIAVFDAATRQFTAYTQENSQLPGNKIQCLHRDKKGRLWIGTFSGLAAFDTATKQFTLYSEKDGLQNTMVYQIVEDTAGKLWLSTNTGISRLDPATNSFWNFTHLNGLQNANFVRAAGLRLADGELLFGGLEGFNHFYPNRLTVNRNVPPVVFTDLKIANKSVQAGSEAPIREQIAVAKEIRLQYGQNFALNFTALNYTLPRHNHYAYKLDGFDKDWNYTGTANMASYTNLDPGEYTFRVKAGNNDGIWNTEATTIKIFVKPPFWRTPTAYIFYIVAAAGLLLYSRYRGITKLQRQFALEQERQEVKRVQELDRMKLKFLTNLSHDFRTPISLIMGPVEQLIAGEGATGKLDKLNMIRRNARRLLNLVNQLLDFRKMEEHELKLQLSKGELISFVKEVTDAFGDLSERKHINFSFNTDINRLDAYFDHDKIERILFNLLSNAFKFTLAGGSVTVSLQTALEALDTEWVSLQIKDTGIGIPTAKQHLLFERFFQHDTDAAVPNQGTGIGLSITQAFVILHGGNITVESMPGKGSTFLVKLPLKRAAETTTAVEPALLPATEPTAPTYSDTLPALEEKQPADAATILLVEDNDDFRFYLKDNLRTRYKVIEAVNGKEGWQKALFHHPHLIVSDITMPEMDGIDLLRKLKNDKRTNHIPVILLTAVTAQEQQLNGLETGANDYITKPFNVEVLHAKVKNLLHLQNTMQNTYSKQLKLAPQEVEVTSRDEKLLADIVTYLDNNLTNPQLSVVSLSKQMGMGRGTLYAKLLELTGQTPVDYIRSFRLEKAAALMEKSSMTVSEIAYHVGFTTPNYFARSFKGKYNMLPSEYIARVRKASPNQ